MTVPQLQGLKPAGALRTLLVQLVFAACPFPTAFSTPLKCYENT